MPCSGRCGTRTGRARRTAPAGTCVRSPRTSPTSSPSSPATRRTRSRCPRSRTSTSPMGAYTERGPVARARLGPRRRSSTSSRRPRRIRLAALRADPPTDGSVRAPRHPGRHRLDLGDPAVQPAARRVDARAGHPPRGRPPRRPGHRRGAAHRGGVRPRASGTSSASASHRRPARRWCSTSPARSRVHRLSRWARTAAPAPVREDPGDPTVTLRMDTEAYVVLCGGRRPASDLDVEVGGRRASSAPRVLDAMAVTP